MINEQNINRAILDGFQSKENMFSRRDSIVYVKAFMQGRI